MENINRIVNGYRRLNSKEKNLFLDKLVEYFPKYDYESKKLQNMFKNLVMEQKYSTNVINKKSKKIILYEEYEKVFKKEGLPESFIYFLKKNNNMKGVGKTSNDIENYKLPYEIIIEDVDIIDNYRKIVILTDYFQYLQRLQCAVLENEIPYIYIQKNLRKIYDNYFYNFDKIYEANYEYPKVSIGEMMNKIEKKTFDEKDYYELINPTLLEYSIQKNIKICTLYKSYLMKLWIKMFDAKNILDLSSGWGDRLLASLSQQNEIESYVGIDPNTSLMEGYKKMINEFSEKENINKFVLLQEQSEKVNYKKLNKKFDLVFWSPPFFNLETYVTDEKKKNKKLQSINEYKVYEIWENEFILKTLKNVVPCMKKNGIFLFYIGFVQPYLIEKIKKIKNIELLGIIKVTSYKGKNYKGYYIFQKK